MLSSCRWMPDRPDSIGYGTSTPSGSVCPTGGLLMLDAPVNSHTPLRVCQSVRTSCGRGYSGRALVGEAWLVHGVVRGGALACPTAASAAGAIANTVPVATRNAVSAPRLRLNMMTSRVRGYAATSAPRPLACVRQSTWLGLPPAQRWPIRLRLSRSRVQTEFACVSANAWYCAEPVTDARSAR